MEVRLAPSFFESIKNLDSWKSKWSEFKGWIRYHIRKDFWKIIITAFKGYPWQESFLYDLEKVKITEMANYLEKNNFFVGVENVVKDMRLACKLISIFNENETDLFEYTGEIKFKPIEGSGCYEMDSSDLKYYCKVYVNTKNVDRFVHHKGEKEMFLHSPHELYMAKAKYLYHKIRLERDSMWWD